MMLSLSTELTGIQEEPTMLLGDRSSAASSEIPLASELIEFVEAMVSREESRLHGAREGLRATGGEEALITAATVAANFQRMVRIADATGIPIDADRMPLMNPVIERLRLREFHSSASTPHMNGWRRLIAPILRRVGLARLKELDRRVRSD